MVQRQVLSHSARFRTPRLSRTRRHFRPPRTLQSGGAETSPLKPSGHRRHGRGRRDSPHHPGSAGHRRIPHRRPRSLRAGQLQSSIRRDAAKSGPGEGRSHGRGGASGQPRVAVRVFSEAITRRMLARCSTAWMSSSTGLTSSSIDARRHLFREARRRGDLGHHRRADRLQHRLAGLLPDRHEFRRILRPQ